jgi:hypothetical protein
VTAPTPTELDQAVIDAWKALAVAHRTAPPDPAAIETARQNLLAARAARGYQSA